MPNSIIPAAPADCERDSVHEKDTVFMLSLVVKRNSSKIIRLGIFLSEPRRQAAE
jgi:hypothetical protein